MNSEKDNKSDISPERHKRHESNKSSSRKHRSDEADDNKERFKDNKDYDRHTDRHRRRSDEDRNRDRGDHRNRFRYRSRSRERSRSRSKDRYQRGGDRYRERDGGGRYRRDNYRKSDNFDHANAKWGKPGDSSNKKDLGPKDKEKPNFALSGKLTEETNTYRGVVIKYSEPPEARKPKRRWRLYPFKGEKAMQTLYIHRESAYLIGRDRKVVDLPVDHPSCSKQHAVLQYRLVPFTRDDGSSGKRVRPYLIDLESANGTYINNKKIEPKKYVELLEKDVIKFGYSSREYVLLHENSKDEAQDDDVKTEEVAVKEEGN